MALTKKISVAVGLEELKFAKKLAAKEGYSLSGFITRAIRAQMAEQERLDAAHAYIATFSARERATPDERAALYALWDASPSPRAKRRGRRAA
jgi:hypothetical protein